MFEFTFHNPVRTLFGAGKVELAGEKATELGKKALLVNSETPGPLLPLLERVKGMLQEKGVDAVEFHAFEENPAIETVADGVALAKRTGCGKAGQCSLPPQAHAHFPEREPLSTRHRGRRCCICR